MRSPFSMGIVIEQPRGAEPNDIRWMGTGIASTLGSDERAAVLGSADRNFRGVSGSGVPKRMRQTPGATCSAAGKAARAPTASASTFPRIANRHQPRDRFIVPSRETVRRRDAMVAIGVQWFKHARNKF